MHEAVFNTVEYAILPAQVMQTLEHESKPWLSLKAYIDEFKPVVYGDLLQLFNHLEYNYLKIASILNVVKS